MAEYFFIVPSGHIVVLNAAACRPAGDEVVFCDADGGTLCVATNLVAYGKVASLMASDCPNSLTR